MRGAIYTRVSTEEQVGGTSLESQREACLDKAKELGLNDPYIFSESFSGATLDRPQLTELLKLVKDKRVDSVICFSVDRLSRKLVQQVVVMDELERNEVKVHFVKTPYDDTPEGRMLFNMLGAFAEFERETITLRTARGRRSRVSEGKLMGGGRLFGYDYSDYKRTINEDEAKLVRGIFEWFTKEHVPIRSIARRMNSLGVISPRGKEWGNSTIYGIISNPAYIGKTFCYTQYKVKPKRRFKEVRSKELTTTKLRPQSGWVELKDATPAIISEDIFNLAQDTQA